MSHLLSIEPLTKEAFAPFGSVIEADPASARLINGGNTERFHALAEADVIGEGARVIISIFRGQPRSFPYSITMMERHPFGSQSFSPLQDRPWLAVAAEDEGGRPGRPRVFLAGGRQGVNYGRNVWHHPLMTVDTVSDFLVVDRGGPGNNLEEFFYEEPFFIPDLPSKGTVR
ncbi:MULTISPECIES: ureidoglycolate lyase [Sinorhizobium]|uniref:Ureidoglycolate lyase n=2 Tax=Sinorhizobium TaxID=28105 RepID=A0A2S3YM72_9HYPH|nr:MULTISPECIES: ureidoglycolate lyase [Sinorhizobium]AUX77198.1 ureidoglycolate hydrolase 1 [Sinorhizobium fredii]PDT42259.1 ureidoglycolate lyase [Sinorhizobium sp. FG01]POH30175.1 ureidoglycolate hydrolase [Sinorhizobium americanum]